MAFGDSQGLPQSLGRVHFFSSINQETSSYPEDQFLEMVMTITPKTDYVKIEALVRCDVIDGTLAEIRGIKDGADIQPDATSLIHKITGAAPQSIPYSYTVAVTPNVAVELGVKVRSMPDGDVTIQSRTLTLTEVSVGTYTEEEDIGGG